MINTVLITGAASGIGDAFAQLCASKGHSLALVDINEGALAAQEDMIKNQYGIEVRSMVADLSEENVATKIFDWTEQENMEIDLLFNNAGFGNFGYYNETDWNKDRAMLQVHMVTTSQLIKLVVPGMIFRKRGYILNNASVAAFVPGPLMSTYHASKAYVLSLSQALADELKPQGIQVSVLCPGMTRTNFAKANGNDDPNIKFNIATPEAVAAYGYDSLIKGRVVAVPGIWNQLSAFLPRLLPRMRVTKMVGNIQRKNHAKRKDQKAIDPQKLVIK
ncbi:SDR family NAD(P)-dependent oxidoreductase [Roseivirga pacifica]|uniref:SDR family NAD(P)-dependent oxidoreductase n=1 Tax=Roseivirga pacifica TaxID=1267423 RepID=UPI0020959D1B|nr:SDR family oxidoreductase [Roseivirga pacifica]MCO6357631.1 SDR family NAD(P)-dependent oxidoreductase [Roseivirga pacifica]MCO6365884.1 SDR family NAD(P)-dependent oxidoreductase [Roseivirga pacifica]MCO6371212.1 SDR family NAD(P)-dependent oxidoreductase [Roseivirga pacifica]MCO6375617.1 SDR family NAD(P)-dependent oxidoreductase [Roseivirga pacifica]MCO6378590.1 SDR family NAD(P)-dependent oxidoreductase [Roseivirga pacifica]